MSDELPEEIEASEGVHYFRGKRLHPFSFERQAAAQRLGDKSPAENDILLVYLCLCDEATIEASRGYGAAKFRKDMHAWADREKITIRADNAGRMQIATIADAIYNELAATDYEPQLKGGGGPDPNVTG